MVGENRDGESHNRSWNCGRRGPTDDSAIRELRIRQQKNFLATLLLSQGVPMIAHGDELGRTQQGNNNTYRQDNELTWVDWDLTEEETDLLEFTRRLVELRREKPGFSGGADSLPAAPTTAVETMSTTSPGSRRPVSR